MRTSATIFGHGLAAAFILAAAAIAAPGPATAAPEPGKPMDSMDSGAPATNLCGPIIAATEHTQGIPARLLTAISFAESGRRDDEGGEIIAWPWTINAEGEGRFFATKAAAIAAVKKLRARGVTSIDVGCMQVNLHHHPDAFASLDDAFDPEHNVAYAAQFLKELKDDTRSWTTAIGYYHSTTRALNMPYRNKVYRLWADARRQDAAKKRAEVIEAYLERRAAAEARRAAMKRDPS